MATTKIVELIKRCEVITQDKTSIRWPKAEWLDWYNDAILFVVNRRPDKSVKNVSFLLNNTDSKQTLPADALKLFTVTRNVLSGRPIRKIRRDILDDQYNDWHSQVASDVDHYIYDERDPTSFYVYPRPANASHAVEILYPFAPIAVTINNFETDTTTIGIDDSFLNPLIDFMLYRAYSKDADYAENGQRAMNHLAAAEQSVGSKTQADSATMTQENQNG
tara:strand:- start:9798 stop:10457 length:660 start_codon:yes stop_codon:yes gene_type:complete